ncbi:MAG: rhomboid family intramembrane serine protease [Planctomycetes bacterium]|nr:rhomboid family intramembrane serine protease [Planctomycetota bacterium]
MGLYDRDYGRQDDSNWKPGIHLGGTRTLTTNLVLFTAGIYLLQTLTDGWVTNLFSLHNDTLSQPWRIFEFLTYGFLHDPGNFSHILFNMFGLWMFGRTIEAKYGRREYLTFYLVAIVFAGSAWYAAEFFSNTTQLPTLMLGASGGLSAVLILFALSYPRQLIYIWGIFPLPAWAFALFFVGSDLLGAVNRTGNVAFTAHLGGALFAYLYFRNQWTLSNWLPQRWSLPRPRNRPSLRIHDPAEPNPKTEQKVDEILKKIQAEGQDSLTRSERRILEKASKEYRDKRQ